MAGRIITKKVKETSGGKVIAEIETIRFFLFFFEGPGLPAAHLHYENEIVSLNQDQKMKRKQSAKKRSPAFLC